MLLDPQAQGGIEGTLGRLAIGHVVSDEGTKELDGRFGHQLRCVRFVEHVAAAEGGEVRGYQLSEGVVVGTDPHTEDLVEDAFGERDRRTGIWK